MLPLILAIQTHLVIVCLRTKIYAAAGATTGQCAKERPANNLGSWLRILAACPGSKFRRAAAPRKEFAATDRWQKTSYAREY
jgi:hypothetical protein